MSENSVLPAKREYMAPVLWELDEHDLPAAATLTPSEIAASSHASAQALQKLQELFPK